MNKLKNKLLDKKRKFLRRKHRVNTLIKKDLACPRMIINRSNKFIRVQVIWLDGKVIASENDLKIVSWTKKERSKQVWLNIAKKLIDAKIKEIVFDRNWHLYHGRIEELANGAREWWLKF
jgi:large subunit ribosomal protein L18